MQCITDYREGLKHGKPGSPEKVAKMQLHRSEYLPAGSSRQAPRVSKMHRGSRCRFANVPRQTLKGARCGHLLRYNRGANDDARLRQNCGNKLPSSPDFSVSRIGGRVSSWLRNILT